MGSAAQLQELLEDIPGVKKVYFQPPETVKLQYPCITYSRDLVDTLYANDKPYRHVVGYKVTVIDEDPDSEIPGKVADLPMCKFNRHYTADNLNHDVYSLYY